MRIAAVDTALPPHRHSQSEILAAVRQLWRDREHDTRRLASLWDHVGVRHRHLARPLSDYARLDRFGAANDCWIESAVTLAAEVVPAAVEAAGLTLGDVDFLLSTTVTGVASPSVEARLANHIALRTDVRRLPLFGLGCVAGAAGVARAADLVRGAPGSTAVLLSVEQCSLTFQREDLSVANQIAAGLFGDGAAAVVVSDAANAARGPEIVATRSVFYPDTEDVMGWHVSEHGFELVLSAAVPSLARERLGDDVDDFLLGHGLGRSDVARWIAHPGGPKVLSAIEDALGLHHDELQHSWASLASIGNLSSASVLFVLRATLNDPPPDGSYGLMMAMGPGFCSELVLLRW